MRIKSTFYGGRRAMTETKKISTLAGIGALFLNIIYWAACYFMVFSDNVFLLDNGFLHVGRSKVTIALYAGACVLFILSYLLFCYIGKKREWPGRLWNVPSRTGFIVFVIILVAFLVFMIGLRLNPGNTNYEHTYWAIIPWWGTILWFGGLFIIFMYLSRGLGRFQFVDERKIDTIMYFLFAALLSIMGVWASYMSNYFNDDLHHFDSYYGSIYSIGFNAPLSAVNHSIYGNYTLFLGLAIKVLMRLGVGDMFTAFLLIRDILSFLFWLGALYAIYAFVKNRTLRYICAVAIMYPAFWGASYLQHFFHRQLVIAIMATLLAFLMLHPRQVRWVLPAGYVMACLFVVWSTDFGIIALLTWCVVSLHINLQKYTLRSARFWLAVLACAAAAVVCILGALGILNLYNYIVGGPVLGLEFLFILLGNEGYLNWLNEMLPFTRPAMWMLLLPLLLYYTASLLGKALLSSGKHNYDSRDTAILGTAVLGLGSLIYYINRPAGLNFIIIFIPGILLLGTFIQQQFPSLIRLKAAIHKKSALVWDGIGGGLGLASLALVFSLALANSGQYMAKMEFFSFLGFRSTHYLERSADFIGRYIPPHTPAFGGQLTQVYARLGWNKQIHTKPFGSDGDDLTVINYRADYLDNTTAALMLDDYSRYYLLDSPITEAAFSQFESTHTILLNSSDILYARDYFNFSFWYYVPAPHFVARLTDEMGVGINYADPAEEFAWVAPYDIKCIGYYADKMYELNDWRNILETYDWLEEGENQTLKGDALPSENAMVRYAEILQSSMGVPIVTDSVFLAMMQEHYPGLIWQFLTSHEIGHTVHIENGAYVYYLVPTTEDVI